MDNPSAPVNVGSLPPTQYLIMEILAARYRTGENAWPFPKRLRPFLEQLHRLGLVQYDRHSVPEFLRASLTETGRKSVIQSTYTPPTPAHCCSHVLAVISIPADVARCGDYPAPCNCDDPATHNGH